MKLIEITYTKIFENKATLFFIGENKTKKKWKIHAKSAKRNVVHLCFVSRIPRFNQIRTRNEPLWHVFIALEDILKEFKF